MRVDFEVSASRLYCNVVAGRRSRTRDVFKTRRSSCFRRYSDNSPPSIQGPVTSKSKTITVHTWLNLSNTKVTNTDTQYVSRALITIFSAYTIIYNNNNSNSLLSYRMCAFPALPINVLSYTRLHATVNTPPTHQVYGTQIALWKSGTVDGKAIIIIIIIIVIMTYKLESLRPYECLLLFYLTPKKYTHNIIFIVAYNSSSHFRRPLIMPPDNPFWVFAVVWTFGRP